jgi:hypothetical protein
LYFCKDGQKNPNFPFLVDNQDLSVFDFTINPSGVQAFAYLLQLYHRSLNATWSGEGFEIGLYTDFTLPPMGYSWF